MKNEWIENGDGTETRVLRPSGWEDPVAVPETRRPAMYDVRFWMRARRGARSLARGRGEAAQIQKRDDLEAFTEQARAVIARLREPGRAGRVVPIPARDQRVKEIE